MPFTDGADAGPQPTATTYSTPSRADLADVAATVTVVGVLMAILITWLVVRLRRAAQSPSNAIPIVSRRPTSASYTFRPSFAPSEASSKFGFVRKPLRLSHRHKDGSWDFADPDPYLPKKECPLDPPSRTPSQKHRPTPLSPVPVYTTRAYKDEFSPRTPTTPATPASMDYVEPPPPAYCRESASSPWPVGYQPKVLSPT